MTNFRSKSPWIRTLARLATQKKEKILSISATRRLAPIWVSILQRAIIKEMYSFAIFLMAPATWMITVIVGPSQKATQLIIPF